MSVGKYSCWKTHFFPHGHVFSAVWQFCRTAEFIFRRRRTEHSSFIVLLSHNSYFYLIKKKVQTCSSCLRLSTVSLTCASSSLAISLSCLTASCSMWDTPASPPSPPSDTTPPPSRRDEISFSFDYTENRKKKKKCLQTETFSSPQKSKQKKCS